MNKKATPFVVGLQSRICHKHNAQFGSHEAVQDGVNYLAILLSHPLYWLIPRNILIIRTTRQYQQRVQILLGRSFDQSLTPLIFIVIFLNRLPNCLKVQVNFIIMLHLAKHFWCLDCCVLL
ncbi:uncharacterized protein LOC110020500 [Phalaenopsis equestris]|uniref:uncharacterized protein LOC110020500 n=1 Tax=Phalaenopsis equestris TaxID=78828 RepID=UPI0009E23BCB|nr:uncharacterized protein LOC110020500 [Phalaenopsis equestris]